jgi:hypothetical protein
VSIDGHSCLLQRFCVAHIYVEVAWVVAGVLATSMRKMLLCIRKCPGVTRNVQMWIAQRDDASRIRVALHRTIYSVLTGMFRLSSKPIFTVIAVYDDAVFAVDAARQLDALEAGTVYCARRLEHAELSGVCANVATTTQYSAI